MPARRDANVIDVRLHVPANLAYRFERRIRNQLIDTRRVESYRMGNKWRIGYRKFLIVVWGPRQEDLAAVKSEVTATLDEMMEKECASDYRNNYFQSKFRYL